MDNGQNADNKKPVIDKNNIRSLMCPNIVSQNSTDALGNTEEWRPLGDATLTHESGTI